MAVLKDLIVHGRSRFINGIDADSIHANLIDANDGVFKTITTTTLDAETITTDMLKANNARVSQTLTVDGTISTNKWEAANIANIGGNFYISPTGKANSGTITVTKTSSTTINGVTVGVYTLVVGSASFGVTSTNSTVWGPTSGNQSKVIFTGSISYNNSKKYPLGTCNGTMTTLSTGTNTLTGFTITGVSSPALDVFFQEVGVSSVSSIACSGYEMQISVYQSYYSSALHPIGILLTSYGKEKQQYIDIYNGENTLGDSASGFTNPGVRIGLLDGLADIRDGITDSSSPTKPTGWGIYTTNGFFKGKVVSNAGLIGNFTIANDLHSGDGIGIGDSVYVSPGTQSPAGISIADSPEELTWAFTAGDKFGVTTEGELYANKAIITGTIYANDGSIGGAQFEDGQLIITSNNITDNFIQDIVDSGNIATTEHLNQITHNNSLQWDGDTLNISSGDYMVEIGERGINFKYQTIPIASYGNTFQIGTESGMHIKIDGEELGFYEGTENRVAYVNNKQLYITQTVVLQQMDVGTPLTQNRGGRWSWKVHENSEGKNNLYLKWLG